MQSERGERPGSFLYEPSVPPTIPAGVTIADWRRRRGASEARPAPHAGKASMRGQWESAAYAGDASTAPPRADLLAVEVLLRDERGERLRLLAWRATVDEAVAAAEEHAERYLGSEFAYCD